MANIYLLRRSFLAGLLILYVVQLGCLENQMNNNLSHAIFKQWIHSREEDTEGVRVYRPSDYNFPPSRGREGFEIKENGEFIRYGIGPTDRRQKITGTWKVEENNKIRVTFEGQRQESYTIQILSCDEGVLKVSLDS